MVENKDGIPDADQNDPELSLRQLGRLFGVSPWALREQERAGCVQFARKRINGTLTVVGRPSQIVNLRVYRLGLAAKIAKLSTRTLQRAAKQGMLTLTRRGSEQHWRCSPLALAEFLRKREEKKKPVALPNLRSVLKSQLSRKGKK